MKNDPFSQNGEVFDTPIFHIFEVFANPQKSRFWGFGAKMAIFGVFGVFGHIWQDFDEKPLLMPK